MFESKQFQYNHAIMNDVKASHSALLPYAAFVGASVAVVVLVVLFVIADNRSLKKRS